MKHSSSNLSKLIEDKFIKFDLQRNNQKTSCSKLTHSFTYSFDKNVLSFIHHALGLVSEDKAVNETKPAFSWSL